MPSAKGSYILCLAVAYIVIGVCWTALINKLKGSIPFLALEFLLDSLGGFFGGRGGERRNAVTSIQLQIGVCAHAHAYVSVHACVCLCDCICNLS